MKLLSLVHSGTGVVYPICTWVYSSEVFLVRLCHLSPDGLLLLSVQELLPLVFMFELPMTGVLQPVPDSSSPVVQQISNTYGVSVSFKQRPRVYVTTVIIRGSVDNAKAVKEATAVLIENLTGNIVVRTSDLC